MIKDTDKKSTTCTYGYFCYILLLILFRYYIDTLLSMKLAHLAPTLVAYCRTLMSRSSAQVWKSDRNQTTFWK